MGRCRRHRSYRGAGSTYRLRSAKVESAGISSGYRGGRQYKYRLKPNTCSVRGVGAVDGAADQLVSIASRVRAVLGLGAAAIQPSSPVACARLAKPESRPCRPSSARWTVGDDDSIPRDTKRCHIFGRRDAVHAVGAFYV